jgi:hydroxymethylglutaryl-CoA reductase (NADPH)
MDLRNLPDGLDALGRVEERRKRIEKETGRDLSSVRASRDAIGHADEKNCEQMFGMVPVPVGYAGPLSMTFSSGENTTVHLPLCTTEGALVASVNRGCKATSVAVVRVSSIHHGISRSIAWHAGKHEQDFAKELQKSSKDWMAIAEATSNHLKVLRFDIDAAAGYVFLTLSCDTDEAMGMNMITIAAQAVGEWCAAHLIEGHARLITIAANIDSDKKPSLRTYERGRGYEVTAETFLPNDVIETVLKSSGDSMLEVAKAKLEIGSELAGAMGRNLHAANIIAALYLATGQDPAHVVEGSLTDTYIEAADEGLHIIVRLPAIIVGVRGGGTPLPAQSQCLQLLLSTKTKLHAKTQLAETIGAAVLAGEISLLAAQASQQLAKSHKKLGR